MTSSPVLAMPKLQHEKVRISVKTFHTNSSHSIYCYCKATNYSVSVPGWQGVANNYAVIYIYPSSKHPSESNQCFATQRSKGKQAHTHGIVRNFMIGVFWRQCLVANIHR